MFKSKQKVLGAESQQLRHSFFFHITFGFFVCTQDAAQQELNEQKQQYEEKVTHLHEAMVLEAFVHVELISVCHSGV